MKRSRAPSQITAAKKAKASTTKIVRQPAFNTKGFKQNSDSSGFPRTLRTKLKYVDGAKITAAIGAGGEYVFSANGLFKPNQTAAGHQPLYFDQYSALYNHWTVLSSKISVWCCTNGTSNVSWSLVLDDDATAATNPAAREESRSAKMQTMAPLQDVVVFTQTFNAQTNFGGSVLSDPNLQGTIAANPTEQMYYVITAASANGLSAIDVDFHVRIEYDVVWQELKTVQLS